MSSTLQFASFFIYGSVAIESEVIHDGSLNRFVATVPVPEFDCLPGSTERELLSAVIEDVNLEASITLFVPPGGRHYVPGDIVCVAAKTVALPPSNIDIRCHYTSSVSNSESESICLISTPNPLLAWTLM
jgi:hypothetical protein